MEARLDNRVNVLRQQVEQDRLTKFQHELIVQDFDNLPANARQEVKDRLLGSKKAVEIELEIINQRLATREPLLEQLEKELQSSQAKPA